MKSPDFDGSVGVASFPGGATEGTLTFWELDHSFVHSSYSTRKLFKHLLSNLLRLASGTNAETFDQKILIGDRSLLGGRLLLVHDFKR